MSSGQTTTSPVAWLLLDLLQWNNIWVLFLSSFSSMGQHFRSLYLVSCNNVNWDYLIYSCHQSRSMEVKGGLNCFNKQNLGALQWPGWFHSYEVFIFFYKIYICCCCYYYYYWNRRALFNLKLNFWALSPQIGCHKLAQFREGCNSKIQQSHLYWILPIKHKRGFK